MTLTVNSIGGNPQQPGIAAEAFIPDQLIAGNLQLVTDTITLASGTLARGAVLGQITVGGTYILSVKTATDGSQVPAAILADAADASAGAVLTGAYLMGEFNSNAITFDASWTVAGLKAAMRAFSIFLKTSVSAADPT